MTISEKQNIKEMREKGISYKEISRLLGMNENNVSSYCRRHGLGGRKPKLEDTSDITLSTCLYCGGTVHQRLHRKTKKFCSDKCRSSWWNSHPQQITKRTLISITCPVCGVEFQAYKSANKKFCSRKCYGKSKENAA